MTTSPIAHSDQATLEANKFVHSFLANSGEYQKSPHFRPENQDKVRNIVKRICKPLDKSSKLKAIDFGCGTGFMIELIKNDFSEVHGVDITKEMMKHVDLSSGNIYLHECVAENTPFDSNSFDFATAYSFLDHLADYKIFLKEAHRVLKSGGIFYSDLNPNRAFINAMSQVEDSLNDTDDVSHIIKKEILGALHNGEYYKNNFGIDAEMLKKAEPGKSVSKGFDVKEVLAVASDVGFSKCYIEHEWFLGQAKVMHEQSPNQANIVDDYLRSVLPVSSHLFKYLRFVFIK